MPPAAFAPVRDGVTALKAILPQARVTSGYRGPDHPLSQKNPSSYHAKTRAAVDIAPIPGMTFAQAKAQLEREYVLIEAINETGRGRTRNATGDHWHFVLGEKK
jgi:soluble lytic murein transglycosylase